MLSKKNTGISHALSELTYVIRYSIYINHNCVVCKILWLKSYAVIVYETNNKQTKYSFID